MSPTYDRRERNGAQAGTDVETLLADATAAGMGELDIERWRRALTPAALDLCGCMASVLATAAAVTASAWSLACLAPERRLAATCWLFVATLLVAVVAKIAGQGLALLRRNVRLRALSAATRAHRSPALLAATVSRRAARRPRPGPR